MTTNFQLPSVLTAPLVIITPGVRVARDDPSRRFGGPVSAVFDGPAIVVCPPASANWPYPTIRADGAIRLPGDVTQWFDLSDTSDWDIDGLPTLAVEFDFTPDDVSDSGKFLVHSAGRGWATQDTPVDSALSVWLASGAVHFAVATASGRATVSTANGLVAAHLRSVVRCAYDGQSLTVTINGVVRAKLVGVHGPIVQSSWETVTLAGQFNDLWFGWNSSGPAGWLYGLRMGTGSDPNNPFERFTLVPGQSTPGTPLVRFYGRWGWGHLLARSASYPVGGPEGVEIGPFDFNGNNASTPVSATGAIGLYAHDFRAVNSRDGLHLSNNCYLSRAERCTLNGGVNGRFGVVTTGSSGVVTHSGHRVAGYRHGFAGGAGSSVVLADWWVTPSFGGVWLSSDFSSPVQADLRGVVVSGEGFTQQRVLTASNVLSLGWRGGGWDSNDIPLWFRHVLPNGVVDLVALGAKQPGPINGGDPVNIGRIADS